MGFWELLDNGDVLGRCETNFFHIYIYRDLPNSDFSEYEDSLKGTFMHEYLHYIQFVNTVFGVSYGTVYSNYFSYCVEHFRNNENIELPLNIRTENPTLDILISKYLKLKGSKTCSIEVDKIIIEPSDIQLARAENTAVKFKGVNSKNEESDSFQFGYLSIVENMALIFQTFFDKSPPEHPLVPYHTIDIILNSLPKPITDKKLTFSICLCSLMFENPAVGFFDVLDILKANPGYDGIKLYKHLLALKIKHESCSTLSELFCFLIDQYKANIETAICCELNYFSKVFENCKSEIQNSESLLLRLIYDTEINSKESIATLINYYGLPLIEANDLTLMAKSPNPDDKPHLDMANLRGLELVINRFTSKDRKCPMYQKCNSMLYKDDTLTKFEMSAECLDDQWKKQELCLMTISLQKYKLDKKVISQ
jgi:hypothetical protein